VIDYETCCKIHDCHHRQGLTIAQTARSLGLHRCTVATWLARVRFAQRRSQPRPSKLDPFKPSITRLLDTHPYSAQRKDITAASASCAITSAAFVRLDNPFI
jgi:transposase